MIGMGVQIQDMRRVERSPWPHWTMLETNTHEFVDPNGERVVRVVSFERIEPGDTTVNMAARYVPRHVNSYDVLYVNLQLPAPGSGSDPVEPAGDVVYRPESLLWQGGGGMPVAEASEHVGVNVYLHTNGPSGEPMLTLDQVEHELEKLEAAGRGRVDRERGEYVDEQGTTHELLEVCWEAAMGRRFRYLDPAPLSTPLSFPVTAYPWYSAPDVPGCQVKPFAAFNAFGPVLELVKLERGAELPARTLTRHRFDAVLAGKVRYGGDMLPDMTVLFGAPKDAYASIVAEQPSLLWTVQWQPKDDPLGSAWVERHD